jgi:hypothetical protein
MLGLKKKPVLKAIKSWGAALQPNNINQWESKYQLKENNAPKTIAVIMAWKYSFGRLARSCFYMDFWQ